MAALRCQNLGKLDQNQPWPASELRAAITLAKAHALRRDAERARQEASVLYLARLRESFMYMTSSRLRW